MKKKKINYSKEHKLYLKKIRNNTWIVRLCQITIFLLIFTLWELLTRWQIFDPFFVSSPTRVWKTLVNLVNNGSILTHISTTLYETILGFFIATAFGTIFAIILWWSERLRRILDPYIVVLNSLPKIALGPLIIIWVGAGTGAIVTMCVLICVVITTLSMLAAFINCDENKVLLMKSMRANKFQIFFRLILPNALPDFVSVLKINVGMSWVGTIMGEYLVSKAGLGYLIVYGGQVFKLDLVMTSTVILCILAAGMYFIVSAIEKKFKR